MSILTKPLNEITYKDVVDFCKEQVAENVSLDYKQEINNESLAKTIAAMANTLGGVVIVGVEDNRIDDRPKFPVKGIAYEPQLEKRISDIIWGHINPPFPLEVLVCKPKSKKTFIVMRIPQSSAAPHAIRGNKAIYYRTGKGNQPEDQAEVDRIEWLLQHRKKSEEFKVQLYNAAYSRLSNLFDAYKTSFGKGAAAIDFTPLYPREIVIRQEEITSVVESIKKLVGTLLEFPNLGRDSRYVQNGVMRFEREGLLNFTEMNTFGSLYHEIQLGRHRPEQNHLAWDLHLAEVITLIAISLEVMGDYYNRIGYAVTSIV